MIILGVESTAHTFGVGIIDAQEASIKVLTNVKDSYSSPDKGMIPDEMAAHHKQVAEKIFEQAFKQAKLTWEDIEYIAYSAGPGIDPALWAGYHIVKELSEKHNISLVPVNHCCAHLSIGKIINKAKDPVYLYVSGVNTQIIVQEGGQYRIVGETLDNGLGNMLDKFGRIIGLGFPAGPEIEKLAKSEGAKYVALPYAVKGMDMSFSGVLTKAKQLFEREQASKEDLCLSIQETAFAMCAEVAERALAHTGKKELILVGGVGANKRFCQMLEIMCRERGATFFKVPMDLAGDQGAMIAWEGFMRRNQIRDMQVDPHWRTDEA